MIGYLGYCKRVEPQGDCAKQAGTQPSCPEETEAFEPEEQLPECLGKIFWADLKSALPDRLDAIDFTRAIK